ncbi:hypothetical protein EC396_15395 [Lutibacter sp. HS1-25]|uniref:hypothetical protein n=1 Tax=Lutibacter sp. HS1-25 TaxID=2485000 RepID=UPI001011D073|nr:hypothetical protein [Lutibacter sp. HS1-25]RXP45592.1 hypothetical protein EC396_15395 [Lutibacter sp. HS1-25]
MKNLFLFTFIVTLFIGCNSVKKTQEAINYGNYDEAINIALKNLRSDKFKKSNEPYVFMLQDAFIKANERDLTKVKFLQNEGNPANYETIYTIYDNLNKRQEMIRPLLPLQIVSTGKNAKFQLNDYTNQLITSKQNVTEYLYNNALNSLQNSKNKLDFRNTYNDLNYLNQINPNYKNTNSLIEEAHFKGTDFIYVFMQNQSDKVIPIRLEQDLLNFETYGLNTLWTVYQSKKQNQIKYNYEIEINLREINISPEQIREKEIVQEKQVVDGWQYLKDSKGVNVTDSLGKAIKVDKFKTIKSVVYQNIQYKSVQIIGQIKYFDLTTNQLIKSYPLESGFVFEHRYATYKGDRNALDKEYLDLLAFKFVPFPSNEQMIYDSGEDLKLKIKSIIASYLFN